MGVVWTLARPLPEIERHRRHFAELQRQVAAAQSGKTARAAERGRVLRLRAQARAAAGAQRDAFEAEADALDAHLAWGDLSGAADRLRAGQRLARSTGGADSVEAAVIDARLKAIEERRRRDQADQREEGGNGPR